MKTKKTPLTAKMNRKTETKGTTIMAIHGGAELFTYISIVGIITAGSLFIFVIMKLSNGALWEEGNEDYDDEDDLLFTDEDFIKDENGEFDEEFLDWYLNSCD